NLRRRDRWLAARGWHVLRFHASDCYARPDQVVLALRQYLEEIRAEHWEAMAQRGWSDGPRVAKTAPDRASRGILKSNVNSFPSLRECVGPPARVSSDNRTGTDL